MSVATEHAHVFEPVIYWIDADDTIRGVNEAWNHFALANDTPILATDAVGTSLWRFIDGREVRHIYQSVFKRVRVQRQEVSFPFRCDSPAVHRSMKLFVSAREAGGITLRAEFQEVHPQPHVLDLLTPSTTGTTTRLLRMCSWCKDILIDKAWTPLEVAIERLELMTQAPLPSFTHGICETCAAQYEQDLFPHN